jgi:D-glycero-alpha-D-manno-heptose 1-phosphate guanylyltransferase
VIRAVILAGGKGTRVQHLLSDLPKPMAPAAGRPFLEWVVRFLARQGVSDITISTGYRAETIARHFDHTPIPGVSVRCTPEREPMGTAGGFLNALPASHGHSSRWLVCNGDSLVLTDLHAMQRAANDAEAVLLGVETADCSRYGTLTVDSDGKLLRFAEKRPGRGLISAGVYLFMEGVPDRFPARRPLSFEHDVFPALLMAGARVAVTAADAPFLDIGTQETLLQAGDFVSSNPGYFL